MRGNEEGNHPRFLPSLRFAGKPGPHFCGCGLRRRSRGRTGNGRIADTSCIRATSLVKRFSRHKEIAPACCDSRRRKQKSPDGSPGGLTRKIGPGRYRKEASESTACGVGPLDTKKCSCYMLAVNAFCWFAEQTSPASQPGPCLSLSCSPEAKDGGHLSPILSVAELLAGDHLRAGLLLRVFCLSVQSSPGGRERCNEGMGVSALDSVRR